MKFSKFYFFRVGFPNIKIGLTEAQMGIPVEMLNLLQFHCSNSRRFAEYSLLTGPVHNADIAFKYGIFLFLNSFKQLEKNLNNNYFIKVHFH